jgi:AcrR family transcriptional regulator
MNHFGGKDELVAEVLRADAAATELRYHVALTEAGTVPRDRISALFATVRAVTIEPGFRGVIDTGQQLGLTPIGQRQVTDNVQLPQVHRRLSLPALVLALVLLSLRIDQTVTGQHSVTVSRDGSGSTSRWVSS